MENIVWGSNALHEMRLFQWSWVDCQGKLEDSFCYWKVMGSADLAVSLKKSIRDWLWQDPWNVRRSHERNSKVRWSLVWRSKTCHESASMQQMVWPRQGTHISWVCGSIYTLIWRFFPWDNKGILPYQEFQLSSKGKNQFTPLSN